MAKSTTRQVRPRVPRAVPDAPARRLRLPISLVLVAGFGGLVLLGIASVLGLGIASATKNTFDLLQDKSSLRLDVIETRIRGMLDPAEALASDLALMIASGRPDPADQESRSPTHCAARWRGSRKSQACISATPPSTAWRSDAGRGRRSRYGSTATMTSS